MLSKTLWLYVVSLLAFVIVAGSKPASGSQDASGTFAIFSTVSGAPFQFFNSSGIFQTGSTAGTAAAIPVTFQFLDPNTSGFGTNPISALLTITSSVSGTGTSVGSPVSLTSQPMSTTTFDFTTTGTNCVCLLTVTSNGAGLFGVTGSKSATLTSSSSQSNIVYNSSQYLNFGGGPSGYTVSMDGLSSAFKLGNNGYLSGFSSGGSGSFYSAPVPEVGTMVSFGLLILGAGFVLLRKKKASTKRQASGAMHE